MAKKKRVIPEIKPMIWDTKQIAALYLLTFRLSVDVGEKGKGVDQRHVDLCNDTLSYIDHVKIEEVELDETNLPLFRNLYLQREFNTLHKGVYFYTDLTLCIPYSYKKFVMAPNIQNLEYAVKMLIYNLEDEITRPNK